MHPRRTRLGLIEAMHSSQSYRVAHGHPRRTRLGLIEARDDYLFHGDRRDGHPRRTRLGLIEAPTYVRRFARRPLHPRRTRLGLIEAFVAKKEKDNVHGASEAHAPRPH